MKKSILYGCLWGVLVSLFLIAMTAVQFACAFCVPNKVSWLVSLLTMAIAAFVGAFKSRQMLSALAWAVVQLSFCKSACNVSPRADF
jgi:hypothetical protein